jgi:hypothetical protein
MTMIISWYVEQYFFGNSDGRLQQEINHGCSDNIFDALPALSATSKSLLDELTRFLASPTERMLDPLRWWAERQAIYPRLSRMARDYLSVPGKLKYHLIVNLLIG